MDPTNLRLVLQGEIAIVNATENPNVEILTSIPMSCTVFTLYNKDTKVGALAHLDHYAHMKSVGEKIQEILNQNHGTFEAKVCGGSQHLDPSKKQQEGLLKILTSLGINYAVLELSQNEGERKQFQFDVSENDFKEIERNEALEYLQQREFGDWEDKVLVEGTFRSLPNEDGKIVGKDKENDMKRVASWFQFKIRETKRDASILDELKEIKEFPCLKKVNEIYEKIVELSFKTLEPGEQKIFDDYQKIESKINKARFLNPMRDPYSTDFWSPSDDGFDELPLEDDGYSLDQD